MFKPCCRVLLIGILLLGCGDLAESQAPNSSIYVVTRNSYSEGTSTVRFGDLIMISIFPDRVQPGSIGDLTIVNSNTCESKAVKSGTARILCSPDLYGLTNLTVYRRTIAEAASVPIHDF